MLGSALAVLLAVAQCFAPPVALVILGNGLEKAHVQCFVHQMATEFKYNSNIKAIKYHTN